MTILQINDIEAESVVATYGQAAIVEYIKTFDSKDKVDDGLDSKLRALKAVNHERGDNLKKAFLSLNEKLKDLKDVDLSKAKKEYFDKKYAL